MKFRSFILSAALVVAQSGPLFAMSTTDDIDLKAAWPSPSAAA